jgi:hypothetical protein
MTDWLWVGFYLVALLGAAGFAYGFVWVLERAFTEITR